jgi:hypothetical protein
MVRILQTVQLRPIFALTVLSVSAFISFPAKAQTNQSFSQCVISLYQGPYNSTSAAENCLQAFQGKPVNEDFSTCVNRLYKGPFNSRSASDYCQKAFANSIPSQQQGTGNPTVNIYTEQPQSQPVQRRSKQVCVNTTFNQIWDDIHCQFNNGMFEWRTIYLD